MLKNGGWFSRYRMILLLFTNCFTKLKKIMVSLILGTKEKVLRNVIPVDEIVNNLGCQQLMPV